MAQDAEATQNTDAKHIIALRGAIFIGIGSMVGAGIFALFGQAGAIAGAAVWVSFLVGGIIALLQGYSFAKLGARYPSSGGQIDWIVRGFGTGLFTGGVVMLAFFAYIIVGAMVAVSFGNYAADLFLGDDAPAIWAKIFTSAIIILLTIVNMIGAKAVTRAQTVVVSIVLVVLVGFALAMLTQINTSMLAPSTYPPLSYILASVALTFFSYLGFGVIAFTGGDIVNPTKNMPRAIYISLGFTMVLYVALAIGVFGTLTVSEVIENADTALAVAALPIFGQFGFTLISIAALFATTGSLNSQLYANFGLTHRMAQDGTLPSVFGRKYRRGGTYGLLIASVITLIVANLFDMAAIASLGSAVALAIYILITIAHLRMVNETKASRPVLIVALIATSVAILVFGWYTLFTDPQFFVILLASIILAWVVAAVWRAISKRQQKISEPTGQDE